MTERAAPGGQIPQVLQVWGYDWHNIGHIAPGDLNFGDVVATPPPHPHPPIDVRPQQLEFEIRDVDHEALRRLLVKPVLQHLSIHHTDPLRNRVSVRGRTAPNKEEPMKKSDLLARELNKALAEEARIEEKYGTDHEDGSVIAFRVQFTARDIWYEYAAIRVNGTWYTTGPRSPKGYTWEELAGWFDGAHRVSKIKTLREGRKNKKGI